MNVQPPSNSHFQGVTHKIQLPSLGTAPSLREYELSRLETSKETNCCGSFFNCIFAPFRLIGKIFASILGFIRDKIFCCCSYEDKSEKIDWVETKKIFMRIKTCVKGSEASDRFKTFQKLFKQLSEPAKELFLQHLGCAVAAHRPENPITDPVLQKKYYEENRNRDDWNSHWTQDKVEKRDPILLAAIDSFYAELETRTK